MMAEVCDLSCLSRLSVSKSKLLHDCRSINGVVPTLSLHLKKLGKRLKRLTFLRAL